MNGGLPPIRLSASFTSPIPLKPKKGNSLFSVDSALSDNLDTNIAVCYSTSIVLNSFVTESY